MKNLYNRYMNRIYKMLMSNLFSVLKLKEKKNMLVSIYFRIAKIKYIKAVAELSCVARRVVSMVAFCCILKRVKKVVDQVSFVCHVVSSMSCVKLVL